MVPAGRPAATVSGRQWVFFVSREQPAALIFEAREACRPAGSRLYELRQPIDPVKRHPRHPVSDAWQGFNQ
jgi:hypothetical protein